MRPASPYKLSFLAFVAALAMFGRAIAQDVIPYIDPMWINWAPQPDAVMYEIRLNHDSGQSASWIHSTAIACAGRHAQTQEERCGFIFNLGPGVYTFAVRWQTADNQWSDWYSSLDESEPWNLLVVKSCPPTNLSSNGRVLTATRRITGVTLTGEAADNVPITFAQPFKPGDVPAGSELAAVIDDKPITLQVDAKARHPDGSLRHAILTVLLPTFDGSATVDLFGTTPQTCGSLIAGGQ